MRAIDFIIPGLLVWLLQLTTSDLLAIDTVRPDFCVILILFWSIMHGRLIGTVTGFIMGLILDISGTGLFFGLSPLIYSITGYLGGNLKGIILRINTFYFTLSWIAILLFQFFIYCGVQYQSLWVLDQNLFLGKWVGTSAYSLAFAGILQFIYPFDRIK